MANQDTCSRGFSAPNATFAEFRHRADNSTAKTKANGHSGRGVLHKVGHAIGVGASTPAYCDKTNDGSFGANYSDDSSASHALPKPLGSGYTGHHQNNIVPVSLRSKGIHGPKDAAVVHTQQSPSISNEHFVISEAGACRTPYHSNPGLYNFGFEPSAAVRNDHVKRHTW